VKKRVEMAVKVEMTVAVAGPARMLTYTHVCGRMRTYADVC
jgi:hypothetical protein